VLFSKKIRCHIFNTFVIQRRDIENALSWLSTLGGAFSALGDISTSYVSFACSVIRNDPILFGYIALIKKIKIIGRGSWKSFMETMEACIKIGRSNGYFSLSFVCCVEFDAARISYPS